MKIPQIAITSNDIELAKEVEQITKNEIFKGRKIYCETKRYEDRERVGHLPDSQLAIFTSLNPNSNQQNLARRLRDQGSKCARVLLTSTEDLLKQHKQFKNASLLSIYFAQKGAKDPNNMSWKELRDWVRKDYPTFHDIAIRGENASLPKVLGESVDYIITNDLLMEPISIALAGLGTLGLGSLSRTVKSESIEKIHIYSKFAKDDYNPLLEGFDLVGEEKIIHHRSLEGIVKSNADIFLITTGQHGIDYTQFKKKGNKEFLRQNLTEMLFKTGLVKVDEIMQELTKQNYPGLIPIQTNPNGHFIRYGHKLGVTLPQMTSFSPDTVRYQKEFFPYLKERFPNLTKEEVDLIGIGEHMRGGTCIDKYDIPAKKRAWLCEAARARGLQVMKSAEEFNHDYRGVPDIVKECLENIAHFKNPAYPIYTGLISMPAEFHYVKSEDGNSVNVRVKKSKRLQDLTQDKAIIKEIAQDIKNVLVETYQWAKEMGYPI